MALADYSGIVINQNAPATALLGAALYPSPDVFPSPTLLPAPPQPWYQTFHLPGTYVRGGAVPPLTGLQLCVEVSNPAAVSLGWQLEVHVGGSWSVLSSGTTTGAPQVGQLWLSASFPVPVTPDATWATDLYRIVITATTGLQGLYLSESTLPNTGASVADGTLVLDNIGNNLSFLFRVLGALADSGTDFLGNIYRSAAVSTPVTNISAESGLDAYWLSAPNPSQFGVEAFYLDLRQDNSPVVLDRMTISPITSGVYAHLYYSNDVTGPGVDVASWDNLLWTPAYLPLQLTRQQTVAFPQPLVASYIKIEFTNLQPRPYDPGIYQVPSSFRKFPAWVLDFFTGQLQSALPDLLSSGVDVTYDALDLAYSYYTGDIVSEPAAPVAVQSIQPQLFTSQTTTDHVDTKTLSQIQLAFQPFLAPTGQRGDVSSALGAYTAASATGIGEIIQTTVGDTSIVSNLQREPLLVEKAMPPMFFFLPCRHGYRVAQAMFESNLGYFAGVNQLIFHRDVYTSGTDHTQYNEILADGANLYLNDNIGLTAQ